MKLLISTYRHDLSAKVWFYDTTTKSVGSIADYTAYRKVDLYTYHPEFNVSANNQFFQFNVGLNEYIIKDNYFISTSTELDRYCVGTTLRVVKNGNLSTVVYPSDSNLVFTDTADSPTCGFVVNDINITSITQQVSLPNTIATINAFSSHSPIEYSLDGVTYQVSNQFTITTAGIYMAYARDTMGFVAQHSFEVLAINPYGEIYNARFLNEENIPHVVKIYKLNYTGASSEIRLMDSPAIIKYLKDGDDKFQTIKGSECALAIDSTYSFQFLDLFTAQDKDYKCEVYKNNALIWVGLINPESFTEPYKDPGYTVNAAFVDGLGVLKSRDFLLPTGDSISTIKTHLETISYCLFQTGLSLPIYTTVNIYEAAMSESACPLTQAYVDCGAFVDKDGNPFTCYDVVDSILKIYGARIWMEDAIWKIAVVDETISTYARRKFDAYGVFQSSDTYNPAVQVSKHDLNKFIKADHSLELKPAYKLLTVNFKITKIASLLGNHDFSKDAIISGQTFLNWTDTFGILSKSYIDQAVARITGDGSANGWTNYISADPINILAGSSLRLNVNIDMRTAIQGRSAADFKYMVKLGAYWLDSSGAWQTSETFIINTVGNGNQSVSLVTDPIIGGGVLSVDIYQLQMSEVGYDAQWVDIKNVDISYSQFTSAVPDKKTITVINDGNYTFKPTDVSVIFGDLDEFTNPGLVCRNCIFTNTYGAVSSAWYRLNFDESAKILDLLADRILNQSAAPVQMIRGSISGDLKFSNIITDPNNPGRKFILNSMELDLATNIQKIEMLETIEPEDVFLRLLEDGSQRKMEGIQSRGLEHV
jgi:hypothetical protein